MDRTDNIALYERESLWDFPLLEDPYYRNKVCLLKGMIPEQVETILDVGCGNGAITNTFTPRYRIVGGDRSWVALQHLCAQRVQLSADFLPFRARSFDVVMSHQMLEHLPDGVFQRAVAELDRVAKRYLLVSVPYKDPLLHVRACCKECGCKYNIWGHVRKFDDVEIVRRLFPTFTLQVYAFCGRENIYPTRLGLWIQQWIGGNWVTAPQAICPQCGSKAQYQADFFRRTVAIFINRIDRYLPRTRAFWWLVCLFERA